MVIQRSNLQSRGRKTRLLRRAQLPNLEICEQRTLLAATGFLQGVVTLTGSSTGLAGASVLLQKLDSPSIPNQTVTTDSSGVYQFLNLPAGKYSITETPPSGYENDTSQPNSPLTPVLSQTASTIEVQVGDPTQTQLSYVSRNTEDVTVTTNGSTQTGHVGQMNVTVTEPDINYTSPVISSLCVDYFHDIALGDSNLPYSLEPLSTGLANDPNVKNPQNAGEIAYLYNKYGSTWSTNPINVPIAEAAGLQLAVWELEYETSGTNNILNGSFYAHGLTTSSPEYTYAQNFLSEAQGQNGLAVYLTSTASNATQGFIAPESLNFTNGPESKSVASVSTAIENSVTNSPPPAGGDALGTTVYDTATVTGSASGPTPTGTVTYYFYDTATPVFGNPPVSSQVVNISGGLVPNSATTAALTAGSYSYIAVYSGDSNYGPVIGRAEPLTINQAASSVSSTILDSGGGPVTGDLGETVYDTATVTATPITPTGTVTYNFYNTATPVYGTTSPTSTETVTLTSAGTVPNSAITSALGVGSYSYIAVYSGDTNYKSDVGAVEPLSINQGSSSVATKILDSGGGPVTGNLGETVYDTATVTATPVTPTGTVTYNFYNTATPVYGTTSPTSTETVTLTSTGTVPNSAITAALGVGSYSYIAVYSGDSNYKSSIGSAEPLSINQGSSSVATKILDSGGGPVTGNLGETVYDTATVTATPVTPTGTLTYNFYNTATPVYGTTSPTSTETVTLTSAGAVPNSALTAALSAGNYSYIAVYSGDTNYKSSIGSAEPLSINQGSASVSTRIFDSSGGAVTGNLGETVYDTATVTATPITPTGTVTYNFYNTATPVYGTTSPTSTETVTLTSAGTVPNSAITAALGVGSYSYIAVYSGDPNYKSDIGSAEPLSINQGSSSVATKILDSSGGPVTGDPGETVYDTATVTATPVTPTGTVTYNFYNTATPVYGTTSPTSTETVTLTSAGTVPNSALTAALSAGSYSYIAVYSGDTNYKSDIGSAEPLSINQSAASSVSTTILDSSGGPVTGAEGEKVYDTATVTGTPLTPTGTVTYYFYTTLSPVFGTTTPASTQTVNLTSSGAVPNSNTTAALGVGAYSYIAFYSGDANYKSSIGSAEPLIVTSGGPSVTTSLGGTVFCDCNNDGIQQPDETGISDVTLTLTGVDDTGHSVDLVTTTNSSGTYDFNSLVPGTYTITESAPAGYFEGKNTAGTAGGTVTADVISGIALAAGVNASGYNFANITPSTISGVVYYDYNQNGVMDSQDFGIAHVTITLEGTNDLGQSVQMTTVTNNEGDYSFGNLRPGSYELIRTQPLIFVPGQNTAGSLGGTVSKNAISDIPVPGCATAAEYFFGENQKPNCSLHHLALHVGNVFYHFERTYQNNPAVILQHYPNLLASLAAGQVPWGKAPFPKAPVASYWVPTLGTKPIKIFPVHGKLKRYPVVATTPAAAAVSRPASVHKTSSKHATVHTPSVRPKVVRKGSR